MGLGFLSEPALPFAAHVKRWYSAGSATALDAMTPATDATRAPTIRILIFRIFPPRKSIAVSQ